MITIITLQCLRCQADFDRKLSVHRANLKRGTDKTFCTQTCTKAYAKETNPIYEGICLECKQDFRRKNRPSSKDKKKFCSNSCSAKYNNRFRAKSAVPSNAIKKQKVETLNTVTLAELKVKYSLSQYHAKIRGNARAIYKNSNKPLSCAVCDYSKHVDVCHVRAIKLFEPNTTLSTVNSITNLLALCKNHHWEFDSQQLSEEDSLKLNIAISKL